LIWTQIRLCAHGLLALIVATVFRSAEVIVYLVQSMDYTAHNGLGNILEKPSVVEMPVPLLVAIDIASSTSAAYVC
jgi:hypothetical protein